MKIIGNVRYVGRIFYVFAWRSVGQMTVYIRKDNVDLFTIVLAVKDEKVEYSVATCRDAIDRLVKKSLLENGVKVDKENATRIVARLVGLAMGLDKGDLRRLNTRVKADTH